MGREEADLAAAKTSVACRKVVALTGFVIIHVFIVPFSPAQGERNQMVNTNSPDLSMMCLCLIPNDHALSGAGATPHRIICTTEWCYYISTFNYINSRLSTPQTPTAEGREA